MSESIVEWAPAKLNVFLRVVGRRDDGDHDIETVIVPLDLHDVVTITTATVHEVTVEGPRAADLHAAGGESIAGRALAAFAEVLGVPVPPVHVSIDKRIPVAAGMGGGSADAAAVLRGLARHLGVAASALPEVAAAVGADVPALLHGGVVYADGRGDRIAPVHAQPTTWVVAPARFGVRSVDAYAWWDADGTTGPDPGALIAALEVGHHDLLGSALFDDLQRPVAARHPWVSETIDAFGEAGAAGAVMTGSGPTVVALARHLVHADVIARAVPGSFVVTGPPRTMGPGQSGVV